MMEPLRTAGCVFIHLVLLWVGSGLVRAEGNPAGFNIHWAQSGGSTNDDQATSIAVDGLGQVHVAGHFQGLATFGGITLTNLGLFDAFTACYGAGGALLWAQAAGGPTQDAALAVAADGEGNTFTSGYFQREATFGGVALTNRGGNDAFLMKYSPAGTMLWARAMGGTGDDRANGVAADEAGNCFVLGNFSRGALWGTVGVTNHGDVDVFLAKYSASGELLWVQSAGGPGIDVGTAVSAAPDGGVVICGYHGENALFGTNRLSVAGDVDLFIARYDADGNVIWARTAGGPDQDVATAVSVDVDSSTWVSGSVRGSADFGTTNLVGGGVRPFVARYSPEGSNLWVRVTGGSEVKDVHAREGHAFVVGQFLGKSSFGTNDLQSAGNFDAFILRYTQAGELEWARAVGGTNFDSAFGVATDSQLGCVFSGRFVGGIQLDSIALTSRGGADTLVAKLSPAPLLTTQPQGSTVPPGAEVTLLVAARGAEPLEYQWRREKTGEIVGATNATLHLTRLQLSDSGLYDVIVHNTFGSVTSAPAFLNVFGLPAPVVRLNGVEGFSFDLTNTASATVSLESLIDGASMFYTLDGVPPTFASQPYISPFQVSRSSTLRAVLYNPDFASSQTPAIPITFRLTPPSVVAEGRTGTNIVFTNVLSVQVALQSAFDGASMFYTRDNLLPSTNWTAYSSPFVVTQSTGLYVSASFPGMSSATSGPVSIRLARAYPLEISPTPDGSVIATPSGGLYPAGTVVQLAAVPAPGWSFLRWEGDVSNATPQVFITMDQTKSVRPVFGTVLTLTNVGAGSIQVQPVADLYARGAVLQASAVPGPGQFLALWGGIGRGNQNPLTFTINGPVPVLSALFSPLGPDLFSLAVVPLGRGSVDFVPRQVYYTNGSQVTITPQPAAGERFLLWRGDAQGSQVPLTVTLNRNLVITATFTDNGVAVLHETSLSDGQFRFRILGETGRVYSVQAGTDLTNWSSFLQLTNLTGDDLITPPRSGEPIRFFRAVRN